jgi:pimeloyl-ACP methyl ester carboxylesterase
VFTLSPAITLDADRHGPASAVPVILLHGLSDNRRTYDRVIAHLAPQVDAGQIQLVALDLRGHGGSSHVERNDYDARSYANDVAQVIRLLDAGPALVVGHSLGGLVAATVAQVAPELVRALFLEDPPLFEGDRARREASPVATIFPAMIAAVRGLQEAGAPPSAYAEIVGALTAPEDLEERCDGLARWDTQTMAAALDGITWNGFAPDASLPVPCTILAADPAFGAVFAPHDGDAVRAHSPHVVIQTVDGANHSIHPGRTAELSPSQATYLRALDEFLSGALR